MRWVSWVAIALLAGCVDEVAIGTGVCGNWVLEPGEDCDRPDGTCTSACRIRCDVTAQTHCEAGFDGTCCPDGFACGVDEACHAPGGAFAASEITVATDLTGFRVGDLDGDGIADVLGYGPDAVHALYGSARTPLANAVIRVAPPSTGVPAIGDYTGDGRLDVVWPVAAGLFAFDGASGGPVSVQFPERITPGIGHFRIAPVGSNLVRLDHQTSDDHLVFFDSRGHVPHIPCGQGTVAPDLLGGRAIHPLDDGGTGERILVPLLFAPSPANPDVPPFLCIDGPGLAGPMASFAPTGTKTTDVGEAFYARLDPAEACPELVLPIALHGAPTTLIYSNLATAAGCQLLSGPSFAYVGAPLASLVLADGQPALVTTQGIYEASPACAESGQLCLVSGATRAWRYAVVADFDGDGRDDFAVASPESDVEVFFQGVTGWSIKRIATAGAAVELAAGDFDGDGALDLAIAVTDPDDPRSAKVRFAFGNAGTFALGSTELQFDRLNGMATVQRPDPAAPPGTDRADDLALVSGDDAAGRITFVYGAPDREPSAPWIYAGKFGDVGSHVGQGVAALVGPFGAGGSPGLFGVFAPAASEPRAQLASYELANLTSVAGTLAAFGPEVGECIANNFCPTTAVLASVALPGAGLVLAFAAKDDLADCGRFYVSTPDSLPQLDVLPCSAPGGFSFRGVTAAHVIGTDGRVAIRNDRDLAIWSVGVTAGIPTFDAPIDLAVAAATGLGVEATCVDAISIELGTRVVDGLSFGAGREIAAACRIAGRTVVLAVFAPTDPMGQPLVEQLFSLPGEPAIALGAGDLDGDGVEDLVYTTHVDGVALLHARLQCDSHTTCGAP